MYATDRAGATGQMLDIIDQSNEPGKWQQFVGALKAVDGNEIMIYFEMKIQN